MAETGDGRATAYACIVYPESTDVEALDAYIGTLHIKAARSPLHEMDTYTAEDVVNWERRHKEKKLNPGEAKPEVGQIEKAHYHYVFTFGRQKKSAQQMRDMLGDYLPQVRWYEPIRNLEGYTRYLLHLDEAPESGKHRYEEKDIKTWAGFDLSPLWTVSKGDKRSACKTIMRYAREYSVTSYVDLVDICFGLGDPVLEEVVLEKSFPLSKYLEGVYARMTGAASVGIDVDAVVAEIRAAA